MAFKMNGWSAFTKPDEGELSKMQKRTKEIMDAKKKFDAPRQLDKTEDPRQLDKAPTIDQKRKQKVTTLEKKEYKGPPKSRETSILDTGPKYSKKDQKAIDKKKKEDEKIEKKLSKKENKRKVKKHYDLAMNEVTKEITKGPKKITKTRKIRKGERKSHIKKLNESIPPTRESQESQS